MVATPNSLPVNKLKRKASRWNNRPDKGAIAGPNITYEDSTYSLLLFLRDLDTPKDHTWLKSAKEAIDELSISRISHDYIPTDTGKRRCIRIFGNDEADYQITEYDQLMDLARKVWTDPKNLTDFIGESYQRNIRPLPACHKPTIDGLFSWARLWGEVRYRFMNHAMRDDPKTHGEYLQGHLRSKGDAANSAVHDSNVREDAYMAEFLPQGMLGYKDEDREIFESLYHLTPEEGRELAKFSSAKSELRAGLSQVFTVCAKYVDGYIDWRVKVLSAARYRLFGTNAVRYAKTDEAREEAIEKGNEEIAKDIQTTEDVYQNEFIPVLKKLLGQAKTDNALYQDTYDQLDKVIKDMRSSMAKAPIVLKNLKLKNDKALSATQKKFPGVELVAPTGTSLIKRRRNAKNN